MRPLRFVEGKNVPTKKSGIYAQFVYNKHMLSRVVAYQTRPQGDVWPLSLGLKLELPT